MNNSQIATAVAIRDLNCYSLETIDDRILLQKKIYLAQDIGLPLGYGYSWYIHGSRIPLILPLPLIRLYRRKSQLLKTIHSENPTPL